MKNKTKWIINISALIILLAICFVMYKFFKMGLFTSKEALKEYIKSFGVLAPVVFVFIQMLQIIIAPIPGNITGMVGGAIFGVYKGFALSALGLFIGSIFAYYLAKIYGRKLIYKLVNNQELEKYENMLNGDKGIMIIFGFFILPFFPDDILCFLAGLAGVDITKFIVMVLFGRIPGMYIASVVGNAAAFGVHLKEIIICGIYVIAIIIAYKFRKQLISWLHNIGKKYKI
jgi:uncharacterized membrane protein YdjX (TVP38/TMEM64 family)